MAGFPGVPELAETKGSILMRADHMNYSRAVLNSNWHQAREAEPKDYNLSKDPVRDLCLSTYRRIGTAVDPKEYPDTTYESMCKQLDLKKDFTEQQPHQPMINEQTTTNLERDTGSAKSGHWTVLPKHEPGHNKFHLETTHQADYKAPYPFTPAEEEKPEDWPDHSFAYKKCLSQFSDVDNYHRTGRNTWHDESGVYHNQHFKANCPAYKPTDPYRSMEAARQNAVERAMAYDQWAAAQRAAAEEKYAQIEKKNDEERAARVPSAPRA